MQQEYGKVAMIEPYLLIQILTAIQSVLVGGVFMVQELKMAGENQRKGAKLDQLKKNLLLLTWCQINLPKEKKIMQSKYDVKVSTL